VYGAAMRFPIYKGSFLRLTVAEIIIKSLKLKYPAVDEKEGARFSEMRGILDRQEQ